MDGKKIEWKSLHTHNESMKICKEFFRRYRKLNRRYLFYRHFLKMFANVFLGGMTNIQHHYIIGLKMTQCRRYYDSYSEVDAIESVNGTPPLDGPMFD